MGVRTLKCSSCGANLEVDEELTVGFCQYCGAKFILNERIDVNIKIDNGNSNKIKMAYEYIDENNYEKAEKLFKNVLNDDITNHEAWWGRYICVTFYSRYYGYTNRYGETSNVIKAEIIYDNLKYAYKAIENAPQDIAEQYKMKIAEAENFVKAYLR